MLLLILWNVIFWWATRCGFAKNCLKMQKSPENSEDLATLKKSGCVEIFNFPFLALMSRFWKTLVFSTARCGFSQKWPNLEYYSFGILAFLAIFAKAKSDSSFQKLPILGQCMSPFHLPSVNCTKIPSKITNWLFSKLYSQFFLHQRHLIFSKLGGPLLMDAVSLFLS